MISVIVPVYNVEKYLDRCIKSILSQTYKDFELVLIDDGSPDNCPKMCDDYEKIDNRVRVIHKTNGGLSDARNVGTNQAQGEFITYIDSDDYVSKDYLKTLWNLKERYNADITVTGICKFYEGEEPWKNKNGAKEFVYSGEEALKKMLYQNTLDSSACGLLLATQLSKRNPFPIGKYHEDDFITYKYYIAVNRVAVTTQKHYMYMQRKGSIMHTFGKSSMDELEAVDNLVAFCRESYPQFVAAAESKKFSNYCQVLLSNPDIKKNHNKTYSRIEAYLMEKKMQILMDGNCRMKNRIAALSLLCGTEMLQFINRVRN